MSTVGIDINAQPNQVIDAFRKITEEAKRLGVEVKNMSSLDMIPGLEDAKQQIRDINAGMQQMYSTAVRGNAASALRSGRQAGLYTDAISWHQNVGRQFPDQHAQQQHIDAVLSQAGNIAAMGGGSAPPSGGGAGFGGMLPMMRGMLPLLGIGTSLAFAGKKIGDATDEAVEMSALRRSVNGTAIEFEEFRDIIRRLATAWRWLRTKSWRWRAPMRKRPAQLARMRCPVGRGLACAWPASADWIRLSVSA